jgi:membrane-bound lytic murein transglycosylase B
MVGGIVLVAISAIALATPSAQIQNAPAPKFAPSEPIQLAQTHVSPQPGYATPQPDPWEQYKVRLTALARQQRVSEATIQAVIPDLEINRRVIELDHAEPRASSSGGVPSMQPYIRKHVTDSLISRGQSNYSNLYQGLRWIESRYGVDATILLAIYGHETSYGLVTGSNDLLEVLASMAYGGRRRSLFENEFIAALKMMDQGVPRYMLKGSWAGASGLPQFLPSVALRLRADGDGDGYANIWRDELDGLASIASYLRDAGWKPSVRWGVAVSVPTNLNRYALRSTVTAPKCPQVYKRHTRWLTVREWRALGVVPYSSGVSDNEMATLFEPEGPSGSGYLLTNNYRAILDYNCSNFYAMSVGLLADAIARR